MVFPNFRPWVESYIGLDVNDPSPGTSNPTEQKLNPVVIHNAFVRFRLQLCALRAQPCAQGLPPLAEG